MIPAEKYSAPEGIPAETRKLMAMTNKATTPQTVPKIVAIASMVAKKSLIRLEFLQARYIFLPVSFLPVCISELESGSRIIVILFGKNFMNG